MKHTPPLVSILMPNYNAGAHIEEAINSVINQSFTDWELIIVDDGSTDLSLEFARVFSKKHVNITLVENETNLGIPKTRNKLFSLAHPESRYIAILDSDDVMLPERIQTQLDYFEEHPEIALLGTAVEIIDGSSASQGIRKFSEHHDDLVKNLLVFNPFPQSSMLMTAQARNLIGLYDEKLVRVQDYDFWIRFVKAGLKVANIPKPLTQFRVHNEQGKYRNLHKAVKYSLFVRHRYLFTKQFFSFRGLIMWGMYVGGYVATLILPKRFFVFVFDTLLVRKHD